jgi:transcription elongation GreA/GreB family factor
MIQKTELIDRILASLRAELAGMKEGARDAYEEATHEESQPENRFDTHSLEASYRAAGQAKLVVEIESAIMKCQNMNLSDFGPDDPIGVGALVKLKSKRETGFYFLVPIAGGIEVKDGKKTILVITPQSPIGKLLVGRKAGEQVQLETTTQPKEFEIVSVA